MTRNQQLRAAICDRRAALPATYRTAASRRIHEQIIELPEYRQAESIAVYFAGRGEVDLAPLVQHAWAHGKQTYLPRMVGKGRPLEFLEYSSSTLLEVNSFGIHEPPRQGSRCIEPRRLHLVLAPLVAFDSACNRLGMGAGYYDRTLASCRDQPGSTTALVGVAYAFQRVDAFDLHPHDIPMDQIVTEAGLLRRAEASQTGVRGIDSDQGPGVATGN